MLLIILSVCLFKIFNAYTTDEINKIVNWHNGVREATGKGETICANNQYCPASTTLAASKLQWSVGLAKVAENYDICSSSNGPSYNDNVNGDFSTYCDINPKNCPADLRTMQVGENLYYSYSNSEFTIDNIIGHINSIWYKNAAKNLETSTVDSYKPIFAGEFTQIIWEDTKYVGCATHKCEGNFFNGAVKYQYTLLCNYAAAGNYIGKKIYTKDISSEPDCFKLTFTDDHSDLTEEYGGDYVATQQIGYTSYNGYPLYSNGKLWMYYHIKGHWIISEGIPVSTGLASPLLVCSGTTELVNCDWKYFDQVIAHTQKSCSSSASDITVPILPHLEASAKKLKLKLQKLGDLNKMIKQIDHI